MTHGAPTKSSRGAVATGAAATGAASLAAMAIGAVAVGAMAVGALAVGRLTVGRARLRRVEIGELTVGRLEIGSDAAAATALCRVRAAPGRGDDLARLVRDDLADREAGAPAYRAHRSESDPDLFLFIETRAGKVPPGGGSDGRFDLLLRQAGEEGLLAGEQAVELCRTI